MKMERSGKATPRQRHLARLLERHRPHDGAEAAFLGRMQALIATAGDPFSAALFNPGHITASAFVLDPCGEAVLMVHHAALSRWLQPGGHVEPTDLDVPAAAAREAIEETGARGLLPAQDGIFDLDIHTIPSRDLRPQHLHFDVRFLFRAEPGPVRPGEGIKEVRWIGLDEFADHCRESATHRMIRKLKQAVDRG